MKDGKLTGIWVSMDQEMKLTGLELDGNKLTFKRTMGQGGQTIDFEGTVQGDEISGRYLSPMGGEYKCTGKRKAIMQIEKEMPDKFLLNMSGTKLLF